MRTASKGLLRVILLAVGLTVGVTGASTVAIAAPQAPSGITVAPAAIRLELAKGQQQASSSFTVTNNYSAAVSLTFSLEHPAQAARPVVDARPHVALTHANLTIGAGEKAQQTITLNDTASIEPGSQNLDLVIAQQSAAGVGIGVLPAIRLPVTLVKHDGAVTSLGLASIAGPSFAMSMPETVTITLRNTGNMVAIPRGIVTLVAPNGTVVGKGTINEASKAVAPGADIDLAAAITPLAGTTMPGSYRIVAQYGLGGDTPASMGSAGFMYVSWWHIGALAAAAGLGWLLYKNAARMRSYLSHKRVKQPDRPKRQLLIGRDIT